MKRPTNTSIYSCLTKKSKQSSFGTNAIQALLLNRSAEDFGATMVQPQDFMRLPKIYNNNCPLQPVAAFYTSPWNYLCTD